MRHYSIVLFCIAFCAIAAVAAASCASNGSNFQTNYNETGYRFSIVDQNPYTNRDESIYEIVLAEYGGEVEVAIIATDDSEYGHLLHLEYPAGSLTTESVDFSGGFQAGKYVTLGVTGVSGIVAIGVSPIGGGSAPAGKVATVRFRHGAFPIREIGAAPSGTENVVNDLKVEKVSEGQVSLVWHGKLKGDFDLSGEVGIPDITPIALNYLETTESTADLELFEIIDGDGSGEIGIPDVTVIALHYLETLAGYRAFRGIPQDPPIPGGPVNWLSIPLEISSGADATLAERPVERHPQEGFLFFEVTTLVEPSILDAPTAWRVVPTDGENEGVPGQPVLLMPIVNHLSKVPPLAKTRIGAEEVTSADIAVAQGKGGPAPFENGAPLVAFRTSAGELMLGYYLDGWQEQTILDDGRTFTSPSIEIIGGKVVIAISDRTNNEIRLFAGIPGETFEEYGTVGALPSAPSLVRLDFSGQDEAILLAFARDAALGEAKVNFASAIFADDFGMLNWAGDEVFSSPSVTGLDLAVNNENSEIAIAFAAGTFDSQDFSAETRLYRAVASSAGGAFNVQDISESADNALPLLVSCDYVDGGLEILYQHLRLFTVPLTTITVPILDLKAYKGGITPINATLVSGSISLVNPLNATVDINYGMEPSLIALRDHPTKSAFAGATSAVGRLTLSGFPVITGTVNLALDTAAQTGSSFSSLTSRGNARGFRGAYSQELGAVEACYIETSPIDVSSIGNLQNLPAGPLYYEAYTP